MLGVQSWSPLVKRNVANLTNFAGNLASFGEFWRFSEDIRQAVGNFDKSLWTFGTASQLNGFGLLWSILA